MTMELRLLNRTKTELEFEVLGENETLLNPVKQALLDDPDVEFAEYIIEHPSLAIPKIFLRTTGADPSVVLARTVRRLIADYDAFEDAFLAQLKKR